ncbi:MAG: hypothetical protein AMJ43_05745 [Coxiella sp. DG_40]|nr:MAG: hypothetical protein AMJ43_05745 [Coxiella sp. DG_40]
MFNKEDKTLEHLLDLNGVRYVVDDALGLWVKFEVKRVRMISNRSHNIRYSLSLHDSSNIRILGFDNAHAIKFGGKSNVPSKRVLDHWHCNDKDRGRPYLYENAAKLLEDFWREVDKKIKLLKKGEK